MLVCCPRSCSQAALSVIDGFTAECRSFLTVPMYLEISGHILDIVIAWVVGRDYFRLCLSFLLPRGFGCLLTKPDGNNAVGFFPFGSPFAHFLFKEYLVRGAWVAQSVRCATLTQVMISWFVGLSPAVGLCADSSEPGTCFRFCVSLSLSLSLPLPCSRSVSLSLSKINIKHFF